MLFVASDTIASCLMLTRPASPPGFFIRSPRSRLSSRLYARLRSSPQTSRKARRIGSLARLRGQRTNSLLLGVLEGVQSPVHLEGTAQHVIERFLRLHPLNERRPYLSVDPDGFGCILHVYRVHYAYKGCQEGADVPLVPSQVRQRAASGGAKCLRRCDFYRCSPAFIGGFDLGLEMAGMECVFQAENDPYCLKQLARHWPDVARYEDVRSVGAESLSALWRGEAVDGVPPATERPEGAALMVRPVRECVLQGAAPEGIIDDASSLESQRAVRPDAARLRNNARPTGGKLRDLRVADGRTEGGSRSRNGKGARVAVPSLQSLAGGDREPGVQGEGDGLPWPNLICGGFPCQDLSVAGKRAGLTGERSGLFFEFMRIIREVREATDGRFPEYVLIENVPGLLSSDRGRDFGIVLNSLAECGAVDIAWRIIDSQHWVPQRRRRVFIVACFAPVAESGSPIGRAAEILSFAEGCRGHPAPRGETGQDVANTLGGGSAESQRDFRDDLDTSAYIPEVTPNAISAKWAKGAGGPAGDEIQNLVAIRPAQTSANGHGIAEDVAHTIDGANGQAIAHTLSADGFDASEDGPGRGTPLMAAGASVRRLTPVECERLQHFPDGWTDGADGPRYRSLGNAVTTSVITWIGLRIMAVDKARP